MLEALLSEVVSSLAESPMRRGGDKPMSPELDGYFKIQEQAVTLLDSLSKKLAIVLMGEVKAGKSTIMNSLAGGRVSPTDTLECTSAILEVSYSADERAEIVFHDGHSVTDSLAKVFATLESHRGDEEFFSTCRVVKIACPLQRLRKLLLVDTPGLATITGSNERTTREYIDRSDVILWVLNANTLGDSEVAKKLSEIAKTGKPIIIVVNRVDQVDSSVERLIDYVRGELGIYAREVFPLSAAQAFAAVIKDDRDLMTSSGFSDLVEYLETQIDVKADAVKDESVHSSVEALLRYDIVMHERYAEQLRFLEAQLRRHYEEVMRRSDKISFNLENWLRDRVHAHGGRALLEQEMRKLLSKGDVTEDEIRRELSPDAVREWWSAVLPEVGREFSEEWEGAEKEFIEGFRTEMASLGYSQSADTELALDERSSAMGKAMAGLGEGLKIGGLAGAGIAAYMAWLAPYSAAIAFLPAALYVVPPLLVFGGLGGLVSRLLSNRKRRDQLHAALRAYVDRVRADFVEGFLRAQVFPALHEQSATVANELHRQFEAALCNGWSEKDVSALEDELAAYVGKIRGLQLRAMPAATK